MLNNYHTYIWKHFGKQILFVGFIFFYCEVVLYYVVLIQCSWPSLETKTNYIPLKAMILADTHLLGMRTGHWFDKLRREWQMYRAFQTSITIHNPDAVFFLGDILDEGLWGTEKEFTHYIKRFHSLFYVPEATQRHIVVGNHDIGFHYWITRRLNRRFEKAFNASSVQMITIQGNIFILLNSMAMHGDQCFLCETAEQKLSNISIILKCAKGNGNGLNCRSTEKLIEYSRPILLQHFPMYRPSDTSCNEPDSAPPELINEPFRERWECLSRDATNMILKALNPRVIFSGHTHHGCYVIHNGDIPEWTLPSFSWRNKKSPSFMLVTFAPDRYAVNKCYMPRETTVISIYIISILFLVIWLCYTTQFFILGYRQKLK